MKMYYLIKSGIDFLKSAFYHEIASGNDLAKIQAEKSKRDAVTDPNNTNQILHGDSRAALDNYAKRKGLVVRDMKPPEKQIITTTVKQRNRRWF